MTTNTDNASGAGMELPEPDLVKFRMDDGFVEGYSVALVTRLLAESQAHNAKLEAQVERMREALSNARAQVTAFGGTPDPADKFADQIQVALLQQIDAALKP